MLKLLFTITEVTEMEALVAPAGTVMLEGINPPVGMLVVSVTKAPPVGAGPLKETASEVDFPPTTLAGVKVRLVGTILAAVTVSVADAEVPFDVAVILGVAVAVTALVDTVNVADVLPATTVTDAGTEAGLLVLRATAYPPVGAAPLIVTVPVDEAPPVTLVGLSVRLDGVGAVTVSVPEADVPLAVAVMATLVLDATGVVVAVNVAVVLPAGTVTETGTETGLLVLSVTAYPPVGAAPLMVTVPVDVPPPVTLVGLNTTLDGTGDGAAGDNEMIVSE
jgi:hypothetical protein